MIPEPRLSPAAQMALDEYVDELRHEVLRRATLDAPIDSDDWMIGVREIVRAASDVTVADRDRNDFRNRLLRLYGISAGALVFTGFVALALLNIDNLKGPELVAAVTGVSGAVLGAGTAFLSVHRQAAVDFDRVRGRVTPSALNQEMAWDVARSFGQLERDLRSAVALRAGESVSSGPPSQLIIAAVDSGLWSRAQADRFRRAARLRNEVVHGGTPAGDEVRTALHDLEDLSRSLRTVSN